MTAGGDLSSQEQTSLYDLLCNGTATIQQIEDDFRAAFPPDSYGRIVEELQFLRREAGYLVAASNTTYIETFVSFVLLGVMRRDCTAAKAAFFDFTYALELLLREDARKAEQAKYRSTTKDAPQKKPVRDVSDMEALRFRCAIKLLVLNGLLDRQDGSVTPVAALSADQQTLDSGLQQVGPVGDVKERLAELAHLAEKDMSRTHSLVHGTAVAVSTDRSRACIVPILARPPLPAVATIIPGELKYVTGIPSGLPQQLVFDAHGASADWKTARTIVAAAARGPLAPSDEEALTAILASETGVLGRMLISPQVVCAVAIHNAQVCASIITHRPDISSQLVSAIILSPAIPVECVETILLFTARILEQFHVFKYIQLSLSRIRATDADKQREGAKRFATTLHHLVTKASRDNKELYIADAHKADLNNLFGDYASVAEIASRWAEMS
jgi:hypothetical protein